MHGENASLGAHLGARLSFFSFLESKTGLSSRHHESSIFKSNQ